VIWDRTLRDQCSTVGNTVPYCSASRGSLFPSAFNAQRQRIRTGQGRVRRSRPFPRHHRSNHQSLSFLPIYLLDGMLWRISWLPASSKTTRSYRGCHSKTQELGGCHSPIRKRILRQGNGARIEGMAKIDGVVVAEELVDVRWASTPVWIHIHHGRRQEEAGDVCVCIILTASKKGIIKTQQYSHCLVQISDGITRWQRETEREREDTSACD
jgi:hypothetical protein